MVLSGMCRQERVEHLVAQQYGISLKEVRRVAWQDFGALAGRTDTLSLMPKRMAKMLTELEV